MTILAIDTSSEVLSVALRTQQGVFSASARAGGRHSELLCDCIDGVLALGRSDRAALDLIACMRGPGSFSGLRIGFAFVKGLSLALDRRWVSAPTLDCIAATHSRFNGVVVPLLDAKQQRFFCRFYRAGAPLTVEGAPDCSAADAPALDINAREIAARLPPGQSVLLAGPGAPLAYERLAAEGGVDLSRFTVDSGGERGAALDLLNFIAARAMLEKSEITIGDTDDSSPVYVRPAVG